jgi:hypothetical protein
VTGLCHSVFYALGRTDILAATSIAINAILVGLFMVAIS